MICRLSLLSISTFWDSYYYYRIGFFQGISISYRSNIFESLLLYSVSCTNCEVFDKKKSYISGGSRNSESCNLYINRSYSHKNFQYLGAKCWNNLSADMRSITDVDSFNKSYKKLLLDSITTDNNYTLDNSFDKFYTAISTPPM